MTTATFTPKIVGFLCNWCAYAGADAAGSGQQPYPANLHVIRVMCSGRVEPRLVLEALTQGADGVVIMACHPGSCHYKEGNCRALQRQRLLLRLLRGMGIDERRCRMEFVGAEEGERFRRLVGELVAELTELGPLHGGG